MFRKQDRWWYVRLGFVALAFVIYPYLVNQLPALASLFHVSPLVVFVAALVFAALVVVGPDWLNARLPSNEDLWRRFSVENQNTIEERLKDYIDPDYYIDIESVDSPENLGRGQEPRASARLEEPESSKPIVKIFKETNRRLFILGEPGSGKTTELLKLAKALLGEAAKDSSEKPEKPIPVIFELSAWRGEEEMLKWMAEEMAARYTFLDRHICQKWLEKQKIVPLLDGLDELGQGENGIKKAISKIEALQGGTKRQKTLVICCRTEDYENTKDEDAADPDKSRILFRKIDRAVSLCKLTPPQIKKYLEDREAEQRDAEHLWEDLQSRPGFMELAQSPMLLNLMPIAYPDGLPQDAPQDRETCQWQLFEEFLTRKLNSVTWEKSPGLEDCDPTKARDYLAWLAASMQRDEIRQREFLIEGLQPTWLENNEQREKYGWVVFRILWLLFGFIFCLILGTIESESRLEIFGALFVSGLLGVMPAGIIATILHDRDTIELTEKFELSWSKKVNFNLSEKLSLSEEGMVFGILFGLTIVIFLSLNIGVLIVNPLEQILFLVFPMAIGMVLGQFIGQFFSLIKEIKTDLKVRKYPNQGILFTGINTLIAIALAIPVCTLLVFVTIWAMGQETDFAAVLTQGIGIGILFGFFAGGGLALVQHFSLRLVLQRCGRMPGNYQAFLNQAYRVGILRKSGGRFRFYHDKLREHLASPTSHINFNFEPKKSAPTGRPLTRREYFEIIATHCIIFIIVVLIASSQDTFSYSSVAAMKPTIQGSDRVGFDSIAYPRYRSPQRNDIVFFSRNDSSLRYNWLSRRILALPGETVEISEGRILINDRPFQDREVKLPAGFKQPRVKLVRDEYYVIGDNSDYENTKTFAAFVPRQKIRAQIVLRLYPLDRFGFVD